MSRLKTGELKYRSDTELRGYLAYKLSSPEYRPGVLIAPPLMGLDIDGEECFVCERAQQLGNLGYIALALDLYGKVPLDLKEANGLCDDLEKDYNKLMHIRAQAGLEALCKLEPLVDPSRIAAIGYCIGGKVVLELARTGADLKGVVTFHSTLSAMTSRPAGKIRGRVLMFHGANDPYVKQASLDDFKREMNYMAVSYKILRYARAKHSFTLPNAKTLNGPSEDGNEYNEQAAKHSWAKTLRFLDNILLVETVE
jgi:dienelactone hydrolase